MRTWSIGTAGAFHVEIGTRVSGLAALTAVLVAGVALCVQVYSTSYLGGEPRYASYAALISLFTAAMLTVVYSADLIVLLVGWEIMGACSYFLIGHYWEKPVARAASIKAFLMTKAGDVPFLFGLIALGVQSKSFQINDVIADRGTRRLPPPGLDRRAAAVRRARQERPVPAALLAAGRDGRPHPDQRADPRGHDGRRGHLPRRAALSDLRPGA